MFDDVDVIFEEDGGFWPALSLLIENTKRPIILTATNSIESVKQEVKRALHVQMNYPALPTLTKHLKDIVLKECYKSDYVVIKDDHDYDRSPILDEHLKQIELISRDNHCDIRSCINRLQFDFSSVNIVINPDDQDNVNQPISSNDVNSDEVNLSTYDNLILSDLFSSDHHIQLNSRDELDNSCTYDETYKSKDLRRSVLDEFRSLNREQFRLAATEREADCKEDLKWMNQFKECTEDVENHLLITPKQAFYCDYLPYLSSIMGLEQERLKLFIEHTRRARRFMHYLDNIQFYLSDSVKLFLNENYLRLDK